MTTDNRDQFYRNEGRLAEKLFYLFGSSQEKLLDFLQLKGFSIVSTVCRSVSDQRKPFIDTVHAFRTVSDDELKHIISTLKDEFKSTKIFSVLIKNLEANIGWEDALPNIDFENTTNSVGLNDIQSFENGIGSKQSPKNKNGFTLAGGYLERIRLVCAGITETNIVKCYQTKKNCQAKPYSLCLLGEMCRFNQTIFELYKISDCLNDIYRNISTYYDQIKNNHEETFIFHWYSKIERVFLELIECLFEIDESRKNSYRHPIGNDFNLANVSLNRLYTTLKSRVVVDSNEVRKLIVLLDNIVVALHSLKDYKVNEVVCYFSLNSQFNKDLLDVKGRIGSILAMLIPALNRWLNDITTNLENSVDLLDLKRYPSTIQYVIKRLPQNIDQKSRKIFQQTICQ